MPVEFVPLLLVRVVLEAARTAGLASRAARTIEDGYSSDDEGPAREPRLVEQSSAIARSSRHGIGENHQRRRTKLLSSHSQITRIGFKKVDCGKSQCLGERA